MAPWAAQLVQPASGQVRVGVLLVHGITELHFDYSLKDSGAEALSVSYEGVRSVSSNYFFCCNLHHLRVFERPSRIWYVLAFSTCDRDNLKPRLDGDPGL
jgi:hypothetical protein